MENLYQQIKIRFSGAHKILRDSSFLKYNIIEIGFEVHIFGYIKTKFTFSWK